MNRWQRFCGWNQPLNFIEGEDGGSPAPDGAGDAAPTPAKIDGPLTWDSIDNTSQAITQAAFKQLQAESRDHRLKYRAEREKTAELAAKVKAFEEKEQAQAIADAEREKNYKEALALREQKLSAEMQIAQAAAINTKLEAEFAKKGLDPKFMKLLDKTGISIDATGSIRGVDLVLEKLEAEYGDVIKPVAAAAPATPAAATPEQQGMINPLTGKTYSEHQALNAGRAPVAGGGAAKPQPNALQMSKADYDKAWNEKLAAMRGK